MEHHVEQARVACLFNALHGERLADQRIVDRLGVSAHHSAGVTLGGEGHAPKGNRT